MPVHFRLTRDRIEAPYSSDTHYTVLSGNLEIGAIRRAMWSNSIEAYECHIHAVGSPGAANTHGQVRHSPRS
jgi:hypothetical protein